MARNTYHHLHPRGFVNECHIVRCESDQERTAAAQAGFERITRKDLARHVAHINDENAAWGSNRAFGAIHMAELLFGPAASFRFYDSCLDRPNSETKGL